MWRIETVLDCCRLAACSPPLGPVPSSDLDTLKALTMKLIVGMTRKIPAHEKLGETRCWYGGSVSRVRVRLQGLKASRNSKRSEVDSAPPCPPKRSVLPTPASRPPASTASQQSQASLRQVHQDNLLFSALLRYIKHPHQHHGARIVPQAASRALEVSALARRGWPSRAHRSLRHPVHSSAWWFRIR